MTLIQSKKEKLIDIKEILTYLFIFILVLIIICVYNIIRKITRSYFFDDKKELHKKN